MRGKRLGIVKERQEKERSFIVWAIIQNPIMKERRRRRRFLHSLKRPVLSFRDIFADLREAQRSVYAVCPGFTVSAGWRRPSGENWPVTLPETRLMRSSDLQWAGLSLPTGGPGPRG